MFKARKEFTNDGMREVICACSEGETASGRVRRLCASGIGGFVGDWGESEDEDVNQENGRRDDDDDDNRWLVEDKVGDV